MEGSSGWGGGASIEPAAAAATPAPTAPPAAPAASSDTLARLVVRDEADPAMLTPSASSVSTTSSLKPGGAMAIGMAANTSIGGTGTCDASRQDWQVRRCSATRLTTVVSNRGWPATAWPSASWVGLPWRHMILARTTAP